MEKKGLYVVTETMVELSKQDVTQYVVGVDRDFGIARKILEDSLEKLVVDGFDKKLIDYPNKWEWTYRSQYFIITNKINFTDEI